MLVRDWQNGTRSSYIADFQLALILPKLTNISYSNRNIFPTADLGSCIMTYGKRFDSDSLVCLLSRVPRILILISSAVVKLSSFGLSRSLANSNSACKSTF
jgi:hypothetical protein